MEQTELQLLVEKISMNTFNRPFRHQAVFNSRLRTSGGRYHTQTHHLDFNPKVLEVMGKSGLIGVIKHELCHYHLHLEGKGYRHRDKDFKDLLALSGGLRYVPWLVSEKHLHQYTCVSCGAAYPRKRKMNTDKYACGKCMGRLKLKSTK